MDILKWYVDAFNQADNEFYKNQVDNAHALEWMRGEIPIFECPDADIERIYYFRWWTYRKHLKKTEDGYLISEFLPKVPWSGKHNVINAAVGHQLAEGRWLKNAKTYLSDYIRFYLHNSEDAHRYSTWLIYAILEFYQVVGDMPKDKAFVEALCKYYAQWEREHQLPNGMFWSYDDRDAMEYSISGTWNGQAQKGIRPTLNAYMCADAYALAQFAQNAGMTDTAALYLKKHRELKSLIQEKLWDRDFFKAFHYEGEDAASAFDRDKDSIPRELIGYIPWYFGIPSQEYVRAFSQLEDPRGFYTEYGLTTAEQRAPRFLYEVDHECLWNGYIWPYATAQTLTALRNVCMENPSNPQYRRMFCKLLRQYAQSQYIIAEDGRRLPWIDEVKHPHRDEWSSRRLLKDWGWKEELGGVERGKDYNHSTFCDLVITGIVGVVPEAETFTVRPIIPEDWDYFKLENLRFRGDSYTVFYDKTGERYGQGKGVVVLEN